ncbi:gamma-glutamyl-gamma-aminobutyrate hydrolase family protein [Clostridium sp. SHJSY1]|uniref:gamma-glutamyl-gamma-aminobutyrate hydrolase family protein n=1 Tax=Clostridium sp. SHJSY1 TaxID=2942483 RepID=UPI0028746D90|nr:gamma-glutamyl-gamma-aminobutyrate hydrolase family protein [Clostridium sp. SHJSY1]MDS0525743.1 gamma-glutamyl-gamma-aminobutyrate hydrolase family protein [Clostridium sp. SHJSY1]
MAEVKIGLVATICVDENPVANKIDKISVNNEYIQAIEKVGGIPLIIPVISSELSLDAYVDICDGFLFTGGIDINPIYYNKNPHKKLGYVDSRLDEFQLKLMKKVLKAEKPFLAICRGVQILNVVCGGTLYQDLDEIPNDTIQHQQRGERCNLIHKVNFESNTILYDLLGDEIYVNSFHHQSVEKLGDNLIITGQAPDGVIEALEVKDYNWGVGVQWHPEIMFNHFDSMRPLFEGLIKAC